MKIAYFNANLKVGQAGVTRIVYKMIEGVLELNHQVMAITAILPEPSQQIIPMHKVPSVVLPLQKAFRIAVPGYQSFTEILKKFQPGYCLHITFKEVITHQLLLALRDVPQTKL
jgi:hypothetical protein